MPRRPGMDAGDNGGRGCAGRQSRHADDRPDGSAPTRPTAFGEQAGPNSPRAPMRCRGRKLPVSAGFAGAAASRYSAGPDCGGAVRRMSSLRAVIDSSCRSRSALVRFRPSLVAAVHGDAETPDTLGGDGRGDGGNGGGESRGARDVGAGLGDGEVGCLVFGHGGQDLRAPRRRQSPNRSRPARPGTLRQLIALKLTHHKIDFHIIGLRCSGSCKRHCNGVLEDGSDDRPYGLPLMAAPSPASHHPMPPKDFKNHSHKSQRSLQPAIRSP